MEDEADKKVQETPSYQDNLLAHVHEAIIGLDNKFTVTYWNRFSETVLGWTPSEVVGKIFDNVFQGGVDNSVRQAMSAKLQSLGHWEGEVK